MSPVWALYECVWGFWFAVWYCHPCKGRYNSRTVVWEKAQMAQKTTSNYLVTVSVSGICADRSCKTFGDIICLLASFRYIAREGNVGFGSRITSTVVTTALFLQVWLRIVFLHIKTPWYEINHTHLQFQVMRMLRKVEAPHHWPAQVEGIFAGATPSFSLQNTRLYLLVVL